jgi:hypothetical protein
MGMSDLERLRRIAFALPEVTERLSHGAPCFFVREKRPLCCFHDHHNDDRVSLWCPAPPGAQEELIRDEPERFFKPTPSAKERSRTGWECSSTRGVTPRSIGARSLRSSRTPSV